MSYEKNDPLTVVMKSKLTIDQNHFLYQAVNMVFPAVKLGILRWGGGGVYGTDSLLEPVSNGQSMNCSLSHLRRLLNILAPQYFSELITEHNPVGLLRSQTSHLLWVPRSRLQCRGDRTFAVPLSEQ